MAVEGETREEGKGEPADEVLRTNSSQKALDGNEATGQGSPAPTTPMQLDDVSVNRASAFLCCVAREFLLLFGERWPPGGWEGLDGG